MTQSKSDIPVVCQVAATACSDCLGAQVEPVVKAGGPLQNVAHQPPYAQPVDGKEGDGMRGGGWHGAGNTQCRGQECRGDGGGMEEEGMLLLACLL